MPEKKDGNFHEGDFAPPSTLDILRAEGRGPENVEEEEDDDEDDEDEDDDDDDDNDDNDDEEDGIEEIKDCFAWFFTI